MFFRPSHATKEKADRTTKLSRNGYAPARLGLWKGLNPNQRFRNGPVAFWTDKGEVGFKNFKFGPLCHSLGARSGQETATIKQQLPTVAFVTIWQCKSGSICQRTCYFVYSDSAREKYDNSGQESGVQWRRWPN